MGQEYHNYIDLLGTDKERQAFLADALRLSPQWCWDWVKIDFNDQAHGGRDSGKSKLDFYTRNFPHGLDDLMKLHPDVILDGHFFDMSAPTLHNMKLQNNEIIEESEEDVEWEEEETFTVGYTKAGEPVRKTAMRPHSPYFDGESRPLRVQEPPPPAPQDDVECDPEFLAELDAMTEETTKGEEQRWRPTSQQNSLLGWWA